MGSFWTSFFSGLAALLLVGLVLLLSGRKLVDLVFDVLVKRLMSDKYIENLTEMMTVVGKMGGVQGLIESELRSAKGRALERPFGTLAIGSKWNLLQFNPVFLTRLPLNDVDSIGTDVVIGPASRRPLSLTIPVMIGGMSYGSALSVNAKVALAKASAMVGTCTNSGNGPFLPEERAAAAKLVLQYSRGPWLRDEGLLMQADMVEIAFGQGLWGAMPIKLDGNLTYEDPRHAELIGVKPGEESAIPAHFPEVRNADDLKKLVNHLRSVTKGVPIAAKIGATHYLEKELDVLIEAGVDAVAIDGAEGGTHGGPPGVLDTLGIPTMAAVIRAGNYFEKRGLKGKVSLLIGGGLSGPGQFLLALALGADAVFIGTAAIVAMTHTQALKSLVWEPPTQLVFNTGTLREKLDVQKSAQSLANYLLSCSDEMKLLAAALGHNHINRLSRADLCTTDPQLAKLLGIGFSGQPS